jgi:hypothetical protein
MPLKLNKTLMIAVDFDGTIVTHDYPNIGREIPFAIDTLKQLKKEGHLLVLWTVREGSLLDEAVEYCRKRGLEFYAVNSSIPEQLNDGVLTRKITADVFIDDRNLGGLPEWGIIYRMIHGGKPLNPYSGEIESEYDKPKRGFFSRMFGGK